MVRKSFLFFVLFVFATSGDLFASKPIDLNRKWVINTIFQSADNGQSSLELHPHEGWNLYFNENGKGILVFPSKEKRFFTWSLSNDTLNISCSDTLAQYKVGEVKISNKKHDIIQRKLKIITPGSKDFNMSFIMHSPQKTFSDFVFDKNIKDAKFSNRVKRIISKYDHDIIISGYENADGKLHYAYPNIDNNSNNKLLGDDISNVGEAGQWVIFVLYDEKMKSLRKILLLKLYYDEFLVDGIYLQDYMEIKD